MGAAEGLIAHVDQVIEYFNRRRMDLPDGFFDRKTQFVINGAPFETLLSTAPDDPLILMLARGPAGYRFTAKALQHAVPDAKIERPSTRLDPASPAPVSLRAGGAIEFELRLLGTLRGTNETIDLLIGVALRLTQTGAVEAAEATVAPIMLEKIRKARQSQ